MNIKTLLAVLFVCTTITDSDAQDTLVLAKSTERLIFDNQWLNTENMAGEVFSTFQPDGNFVLGYSSKNGALKLAQLSPNEKHYGFNTTKTVRLNNFVYTGSIGYRNIQQEEIKWTARMNPATLNPYMLADSISGLYKKDYVFLGGGFGYKISDCIATGVKVDYMVADGARIKDPRPQNHLFNLEIFPSAIYSFEKLKLGATFHLLSGREKISYTTLENSKTYRFFKMYGLGKGAKTNNGWSYYRNYYSSGFGGELQAQFSWEDINILTGLGYFYKIEKGEDDTRIPRKEFAGNFKENTVQYFIILNYGKKLHHSTKLNVGLSDDKGLELIEEEYPKRGVTYYRTIGETPKYSILRLVPSLQYKLAKPYNAYSNKWELEINTQLDYFNSEYIFEAEESYINILSNIDISKYFYFKKSMISISASGGLNYNLNSELIQLRTYTASQEIAYWDNVIKPDFQLITSNIYSLGATIRYGRSLKVLKDRTNLLYFDLCANYKSGSNDLWNQSKKFEEYCFKIGLTY